MKQKEQCQEKSVRGSALKFCTPLHLHADMIQLYVTSLAHAGYVRHFTCTQPHHL